MPRTHCALCFSLDHTTQQCEDYEPGSGTTMTGGAGKEEGSRTGSSPWESSEGSRPICLCWNQSQCTSATCRYRHICLECHQFHKAQHYPIARHFAPYGRGQSSGDKGKWPFQRRSPTLGRGGEPFTTSPCTQVTGTIATIDLCSPEDTPPLMNEVSPNSILAAMCTPSISFPNHSAASLYFSTTTLSTITNKAYPYTRNLLALDRCSRPSDPPPLPPIGNITTPLHWQAWGEALQGHPDRELCTYLMTGIQTGFHLGFDHSHPLQSAEANIRSALLNPAPVRDYLAKECKASRVIGPVPLTFLPLCHVSRFGVIHKHCQPGKWRLILDLSFPPGRSINDGIPEDLCPLQFTTVDNAAMLITELGQGSLLAKVDISHAYHNIPQDRRLLGMAWEGALFVDTTLPFGLRSAPKIFCVVSDTLEWVLYHEGISSCFHYIYDFLTVGSPSSSQCRQNLVLLQSVCHRLGVPLAADKIEGPATVLTFLGIELDTQNMIVQLPRDKLEHLQSLVAQWLDKKAATKREMLSLIGELAHACEVVQAGRTFLWCLYVLITTSVCPCDMSPGLTTPRRTHCQGII